MGKPTTVAVFFGGKSNEHEISVITGMLAVNLLRGTYSVVPVYLTREGGMETSEKMRSVADFRAPRRFLPVRLEGPALVSEKRRKRVALIDVALNCCHGGPGEDGTLSALLQWNGIRLASPGVPMSAVFMDKTISKLAARGLGLPVLPSFTVREKRWRERREEVLAEADSAYPVVVKPARLGSSIGVRVARTAEELGSALDLAFGLDNAAIVESYLEGKRDINCAAYKKDGKIVLSPLEEVFSGGELLTFGEKYEGKNVRPSEIPADLPEPCAAKIRESTEKLYEAFGGRGVVRADFLVSGDDVFFNELNTVPGSLAGYLFGGTLTACRDFLIELVEEGLRAEEAEKEVFASGILDKDLFSKGAKRARSLSAP